MLGWPPCLQALAATTLLIPEGPKLTQNAPLNVCSPRSFKDLLFHRAFLSLPSARLQILHAHLLNPSLSFMPCKPLNPARLLPTQDAEAGHLSQDCVQTLDVTLNPFEHITNQPLTDPTVPSWFIDATAQKQAPFRAGYAIVQGRPDKAIPPRLIKSATLPAHTSSQQAELIALTQDLTLAKDQKINIYTDSKYIYIILHSNIIIWKGRGFLTQRAHLFSMLLLFLNSSMQLSPKTSHCNTLLGTSATWSYLLLQRHSRSRSKVAGRLC